MRYEQIIKSIEQAVWAIHQPKLEEIIGVVEARSRGMTPESALGADRWAALEARRTAHLGRQGRIHVMGLHGTISQRVGLMTGSGGVSTDEFGREFDQAVSDPDVGAILMDVDSPGGSVFGVHELSQKIFEARGKKPIVAIANSEAYSAGYYIASAADELWVTPTGMVGSIGVLSMHIDWSRWNEQQGLGVTYIHAGKYKVEGNADAPLDKEARGEMQRHVDRYYRMFVESVARNRGTTVERVETEFGQGRIVGAEDALRRGMADRMGTLEDAVREVNGRTGMTPRVALRRRRVALYCR
jgi:signal peptide peptidase SppA